MSHPVPACHPADRLAGLQGLFDKADLLVVTPLPPTLGAQHIDLHSRRDLKARLKVKSSGRLANYTRRSPPEGYPGAAKRPIVPGVDPAPCCIGLALGQNRHRGVSRPEGFHLQPLAEPGVRLSPHPAPIRQACRLVGGKADHLAQHCAIRNARRQEGVAGSLLKQICNNLNSRSRDRYRSDGARFPDTDSSSDTLSCRFSGSHGWR